MVAFGWSTTLDALVDWLNELVSRQNNLVGYAIMAGAAAIEYVFPPFPGDTITLFGAVLITAYGWSFAGVFGAVMVGSIAGAMIAFGFGHRIRVWRSRRADKQHDRVAAIDDLVDKFRRYGAIYLVINRFLPGIRALFFVAAGMAAMRPLAVMFYSAVSAALWNLGLIALGSLIGANFEQLLGWVRTYSIVAWIAVGAVILFFVARAIIRRRRA